MDKLERWTGHLPDEELAVCRKAGFGRRIGMGRRVALPDIETTWMFLVSGCAMCGRRMPELETALEPITNAFRAPDLPIR